MTVNTQTETRRMATISVRIPKSPKALIQNFVSLNTHVNESDFIRDAIREKIRREAPELYSQLFQET